MRRYSLFLTEKCNKNCWYCDIPSIENPKNVCHETLEKCLSWNIMKQINLTGGEIGLLDKSIFEYLFSLDIDISINTNGLFLKRYPEYYEKVSSISLHPTTNILDFKKTDDPLNKITYNYPLIDINTTFYIVKTNPDCMFNLSLLVQKKTDIVCFEKMFYRKAYMLFHDTNNITELTKRKLKNIVNKCKISFSDCHKSEKMINIDCVNNQIQSCYTSHTRSHNIELTKENLLNPIFTEYNSLCDSCVHLYGYLDE